MTFLWGYSGQPPQDRGPDPRDHTARHAAEQAEARVDRALLTMEAIWSILRDRLGVTDEQLIERLVEIDLSDGILDGKVRRPALRCPSCDRTIPRRFPRCMYCGTEIVHDPFA